MKHFLVLISFVTLFLSSCSNKSDGVTFNDELVGTIENLSPTLENSSDRLIEFSETQNLDSIVSIVGMVEKKIDSVVDKLEKNNVPSSLTSAEEYRNAVISYFKNTKKVYSYFKYIAQEKNLTLKNEYKEKLKDILAKRKEWLNYIDNAQNDFARRNGFKVEPKNPYFDIEQIKKLRDEQRK